MQNNVDAGHILVFHRTEVVSRTGAGHAVGVVVLDDMADVQDAVVAAPGTQLGAVVFGVQIADNVHIGNPNPIGIHPDVIPNARKHTAPVFAQSGFQQGLQLVMPGEMGIAVTDPGEEAVFHIVAETGFIGEKAQERIAEVFFQFLVMGFIDIVHKNLYRLGSEHIAVMFAEIIQTTLGFQQHQNSPVTFGKIEPDQTVFQVVRNVQNFRVMGFVGNVAAGENGHDLILGGILPAVHHGVTVGDGAGYVDVAFGDAPGTQMGVFLFAEGIVGGAGGEMFVIQNPDTHTLAAAVVEDQPHIRPPFFPAEILVGTGFQADRADTAVIDPVQFPDDQGILFSVKPQERCHVVMLFVLQIFQ